MLTAHVLRAGSPEASRSEAERRVAMEDAATRPWTFESMYEAYAPFVWRNACRLGVSTSAAEDLVQEVFLVVHRRLSTFDERTSARAWLSAILIRVVRAYWRKKRQKEVPGQHPPVDPDGLSGSSEPGPCESAERSEAVRELYAVLSGMNKDRREVFVLSELEELTAPEIAHALGMNVNTVYFRLRTARKEFERIVLRRAAAARGRP
jgi:RNA polymerase sigma-70 factor (ECF subfamily)